MRKFEEFMLSHTSAEATEVLREIQIVMDSAIDKTPRMNGYGINEIKFDFLSEERAKEGIQLNLETKGSAIAKNKDHVNGMLQRLVSMTRTPLWNKHIFFEVMYHQLHASETMYEDNNTTLHFNVICAAIVFNR